MREGRRTGKGKVEEKERGGQVVCSVGYPKVLLVIPKFVIIIII